MSELVTNAVLHGHTSIDVTIALFVDRVCCEIRDNNRAAPAIRGYDQQASTGRGLGLVAAVASDCGVQSFGLAGKAVWFCIGGDVSSEGADAWGVGAAPDLAGTGEPTVVLQGMPPTL